MTVNDEFGKMWNEAVITYFKVVSQCSPVGTEENHENPQFQ
jgi:hypothetical protein